ncbi:hypothetical protein CYMTET_18897 [Cymbomonas tetramitiformis]|uniref:Uncharacterized protein n=1 Tax=Cymbomonas tetramitiformis TaxID=36881 RepID=A0AAE0G722_9CHLO|nr:hypothetical protein CYMTET_18897 [Cymbomonas tetramitiformis]
MAALRTRRRLVKESDLDASIRLQDAVRDSPTRLRRLQSLYLLLGLTQLRPEPRSDTEKLARLVIARRQEILSAGLEIDVFNFDDPEKGTDSVSDRDGRRALIDLIKGCVPPAVRQKLHAEHSSLRYPAKMDPRPILAMEQRLVRENRVADWTPTELTRKEQLYASLDPEFYAAFRVRYPRFSDLGGVPLRELKHLVTSIFVSWQQQQRADLGGAAGAALSAAVPTGDDMTVVEMLETILGAMNKQGRDLCQGNGRRRGSRAGDCEEDAYALAVCHVFQQASDSGASVFAAAVREYGVSFSHVITMPPHTQAAAAVHDGVADSTSQPAGRLMPAAGGGAPASALPGRLACVRVPAMGCLLVVVPFVGPWVWEPPSPGGAPTSPDYGTEEEEQPTLNMDHSSGRRGEVYIDHYCGMNVASPWLQSGNDNIAAIFFTQPLHQRAFFYGIELPSEDCSFQGRGGLTAVSGCVPVWWCTELLRFLQLHTPLFAFEMASVILYKFNLVLV